MSEKIYIGYFIDKSIKDRHFIDKSIKDRHFFEQVEISNKKAIWLGLIKILEVKVPEKSIEDVIFKVQQNLVTKIGLIKQEFYAHFYCEDDLIVIFREKVFRITSDKSTWEDAISYGTSLGIVKKQLDFLSPDQNREKYFS